MSISFQEARQIYLSMPPDEQRKVQQIGSLNGQINAVAEWKRRQTGGMQIQPPPRQSASDIAAMCKSTNKIPELQSSLNECRSPEEASRSNSFIVSTTNPKSDFDMLNANYNNLIVSGDALFGTMPNDTAIKQVKQRNLDLKKRLDDIKTNIKSKEAVIERTNRDFIDTKESQPEKEDDKKIHVLDDYTLIVLLISYIFMALTFVFWYAQANFYSPASILKSLGMVVVVSVLLFIITINFL
jgi:hypothetical protein